MTNWKSIPNQPARYEASDDGQIRSGPPWRILSGDTDKDGYRRVLIGGRHLKVHRLICETFHGPPPAGSMCAHADGNPSNNAADNLRWATAAENASDSLGHGTFHHHRPPVGETHPNAKLTDAEASELRQLAAAGTPQRQLARLFGIAQSQVCRIINHQSRPEGDRPNTAAKPNPRSS